MGPGPGQLRRLLVEIVEAGRGFPGEGGQGLAAFKEFQGLAALAGDAAHPAQDVERRPLHLQDVFGLALDEKYLGAGLGLDPVFHAASNLEASLLEEEAGFLDAGQEGVLLQGDDC